jgi:hypothetical protein
VKHLLELDQMTIGVACIQLIAGAYKDDSDEDIRRGGYANREEVEMKGRVHLAEDLIELIKTHARKKRERLGGQLNEVDIIVALVDDSRTGKSETAEKMEGILKPPLV